jgi:hypothetical protein
MRRLLIVALFSLAALSWSLSITVTNPPQDIVMDLGGNYYSPTGLDLTLQVVNDTGGPVRVYTHAAGPLTNQSNQNIKLPDPMVYWKGHYISSGSFSRGTVDTVPYRYADDEMAILPPGVAINLSLGTQIRYMPSVVPAGRYTTQLVYTVTP